MEDKRIITKNIAEVMISDFTLFSDVLDPDISIIGEDFLDSIGCSENELMRPHAEIIWLFICSLEGVRIGDLTTNGNQELMDVYNRVISRMSERVRVKKDSDLYVYLLNALGAFGFRWKRKFLLLMARNNVTLSVRDTRSLGIEYSNNDCISSRPLRVEYFVRANYEGMSVPNIAELFRVVKGDWDYGDFGKMAQVIDSIYVNLLHIRREFPGEDLSIPFLPKKGISGWISSYLAVYNGVCCPDDIPRNMWNFCSIMFSAFNPSYYYPYIGPTAVIRKEVDVICDIIEQSNYKSHELMSYLAISRIDNERIITAYLSKLRKILSLPLSYVRSGLTDDEFKEMNKKYPMQFTLFPLWKYVGGTWLECPIDKLFDGHKNMFRAYETLLEDSLEKYGYFPDTNITDERDFFDIMSIQNFKEGRTIIDGIVSRGFTSDIITIVSKFEGITEDILAYFLSINEEKYRHSLESYIMKSHTMMGLLFFSFKNSYITLPRGIEIIDDYKDAELRFNPHLCYEIIPALFQAATEFTQAKGEVTYTLKHSFLGGYDDSFYVNILLIYDSLGFSKSLAQAHSLMSPYGGIGEILLGNGFYREMGYIFTDCKPHSLRVPSLVNYRRMKNYPPELYAILLLFATRDDVILPDFYLLSFGITYKAIKALYTVRGLIVPKFYDRYVHLTKPLAQGILDLDKKILAEDSKILKNVFKE